MVKRTLKALTAGAAIIGVAGAVPASALDLSVGGVSVSTSGGVSVSASVGGTSVSASVGGGSGVTTSASVGNTSASASVGGGDGSIANVDASVGGNDASLDVGTGDGPLASVDSNGNLIDGSTTDADINLGSLFGLFSFDGTTSGSNGPIDAEQAGTIFAALTGDQQLAVKQRCSYILRFPNAYDSDLVTLCRILRRI